MKNINSLKYLKILSIASILFSGNSFANENSKADMLTSAEVEGVCFIQANDVNFGQVSLPLTTQGASSQMTVLCSEGLTYRIGLSYTGSTGAASGGNYSVSLNADYSSWAEYNIYENNVKVGIIACDNSNYMGFYSKETAALMGFPNFNGTFHITGSYCNGKQFLQEKVTSIPGYSPTFGTMLGLSKGDNLAYKITIPDDNTKIWSSGNNVYRSTGTGVKQNISVNAQIIPDKSSSLYVAQDNYLSNVVVEIEY